MKQKYISALCDIYSSQLFVIHTKQAISSTSSTIIEIAENAKKVENIITCENAAFDTFNELAKKSINDYLKHLDALKVFLEFHEYRFAELKTLLDNANIDPSDYMCTDCMVMYNPIDEYQFCNCRTKSTIN